MGQHSGQTSTNEAVALKQPVVHALGVLQAKGCKQALRASELLPPPVTDPCRPIHTWLHRHTPRALPPTCPPCVYVSRACTNTQAWRRMAQVGVRGQTCGGRAGQ